MSADGQTPRHSTRAPVSEAYVVRIYRRSGDPPELVGEIERAGDAGRFAFHGRDELYALLAKPPRRRARRR